MSVDKLNKLAAVTAIIGLIAALIALSDSILLLYDNVNRTGANAPTAKCAEEQTYRLMSLEDQIKCDRQ